MSRKARAKIPLGLLSPAEKAAILNAAAQSAGVSTFFSSLEELLTSPEGFGLVTATPVQRAICRLIEGRPLAELWDCPEVLLMLGLTAPGEFPRSAEVVILAGVRGAKSMIAAATALWASQTCDLSKLSAGEIPRYNVVSLSLDNAKVVYGHLLGALKQPRLRGLEATAEQAAEWAKLLKESSTGVVGSLYLWHPSGRPVEIRVVAGKRAGGSLVSRWCIGATFDEAPRMIGQEEGVINYEDSARALRTRLLPGAQILSIGSPWQPYGPIYDRVQTDFGSPNANTIVIKARGPWMNPFWWTPERCEQIRVADPIAYQTDVEAEFADLEESLFPQVVIARCLRQGQAPHEFDPTHEYVAAMDPATRNNAWTLIIADRKGLKKRVVCAMQWQGTSSQPLSPREVLQEARGVLADYGLDWAYTDQWAADALRDLALGVGLYLVIEDWTEKGKIDAFLNLATAMTDGTIEVPNDPVLTKDLRLVKRMVTHRGVAIRLPHTTDGRHCDYAPALARAMNRWIQAEKLLPPQEGDDGYWAWWAEQQEAKEAAELENPESWWEHDPWAN